jgi:hypothetical protein
MACGRTVLVLAAAAVLTLLLGASSRTRSVIAANGKQKATGINSLVGETSSQEASAIMCQGQSPKKLFLDVGSKRGDVIQAFFDQKHPPDSNNPQWKFAIPKCNPSEWHVIGFEASPRHGDVLRQLENKYNTGGQQQEHQQRLEILSPVAVWNTTGEVLHLGVDDRPKSVKWGEWASTLLVNLTGTTVPVHTLNFGAFLSHRVCPKQDTVYLKMNIEGAEFVVIKDLMKRGLLCHINHIDIYWHVYLMPKEEQQAATQLVDLVKEYFKHICGGDIHVWNIHLI